MRNDIKSQFMAILSGLLRALVGLVQSRKVWVAVATYLLQRGVIDASTKVLIITLGTVLIGSIAGEDMASSLGNRPQAEDQAE